MRSWKIPVAGLAFLLAIPGVWAQEKAPRDPAQDRKRPSAGTSSEGGAGGTLPATQAGPAIIVHPTPTVTVTSTLMPPSGAASTPSPTVTPTVSGTPQSPPQTPTFTTTPTSTLTMTPTPGVFIFSVSPKPGDDGRIRFRWGVNVQADEVFLKVYSSGFRLVHGWHFNTKEGREYLIAGSHEFLWDGRDGYGRRFPPGLYLCFIDIRVGERHFESSGRTGIP